MDRGRAVAATILYSGSAIAGVVVEANLRYLPEWPGSPEGVPASLVMVASITVIASLGSAAAFLLEAASLGKPRGRVLAMLGLPPAVWGFWILTVLYYTVVEWGVPGPRILGLGLAPAYVSWLIAGPLTARLSGGLVYGIGFTLAGVLGVASLSMFAGLTLAGEGDAWSRIAGHGIIMTSTAFLVAGLTLYSVYAGLAGGGEG